MSAKKRYGFGQVDDRVQNRGVDVQLFGMFQREICEEIHKSLESDHRVGTIIESGDMFGRGAAFEPFGPQLPTSAVIPEPIAEKPPPAALFPTPPPFHRPNPGHNPTGGRLFPDGVQGTFWGGFLFF